MMRSLHSPVRRVGKLPMFPSPELSVSFRRPAEVILLLIAVAITCAVLYNAAPGPLRRRRALPVHVLPAEGEDVINLDNEQVRLKKVLKEAATEDKTVILTTLNSAWASPNSILDIFIESFRIGNGTRVLLDHLVMIALDKKAYARCVTLHPYCFALATEGIDFSGEKEFMSVGYLNMMWRRIDFLRGVLEVGYNFIFSAFFLLLSMYSELLMNAC